MMPRALRYRRLSRWDVWNLMYRGDEEVLLGFEVLVGMEEQERVGTWE